MTEQQEQDAGRPGRFHPALIATRIFAWWQRQQIFAWWLRQMSSLLPGRLARGGAVPDAVIVAIDALGNEAALATPAAKGMILVRRGIQEIPVEPLDLSRPKKFDAEPSLPVGLRLPAGMILRRHVSLPIAAARDLRTVIGFEIDRLTPFGSQEVFWGVTAVKRDQSRATLTLTLFVVLRSSVQGLVETLGHIGLMPAFIEAEGGRIELAKTIRASRRPLPKLLYGICCCLALACIAVPIVRQQVELDGIEHRIAMSAPATQAEVRLRQQFAVLASGQAVATTVRQGGDILDILATLTTALPDGTWLSDLSLTGNDLTIDGQSSDAAHLISVFAASPGFHDPRFTAPVTRAIDGSTDLFSIHISVGKS